MRKALSLVGAVVVGFGLATFAGPGTAAQAPAAQSDAAAARTVWYFYTVKWGSQDEFLDLFQKNHYPVLKDQMKQNGRITSVKTFVPTYHGDGRSDWTFAVAITFRNTAAMTGPSGEEEITRRLYPDQPTFRREEQRRFEIVTAHSDVPLNEIDMATRLPSR